MSLKSKYPNLIWKHQSQWRQNGVIDFGIPASKETLGVMREEAIKLGYEVVSVHYDEFDNMYLVLRINLKKQYQQASTITEKLDIIAKLVGIADV